MADLIAIGYPDETTAEAAADEARQLAKDLIIEPDAIAVIVRDKSGDYHVHTRHHLVGGGATWGMFWGLLFGLLFFIPVFGMAIGAGLGALMGKVTKSGIDAQFQDQVRGMLQPGTSALFLMVEKSHPGQSRRGHEQVRRHRTEDLIVQGRRTGAPGRPARRHYIGRDLVPCRRGSPRRAARSTRRADDSAVRAVRVGVPRLVEVPARRHECSAGSPASTADARCRPVHREWDGIQRCPVSWVSVGAGSRVSLSASGQSRCGRGSMRSTPVISNRRSTTR